MDSPFVYPMDVMLTSCIPKCQFNVLSIYFDIGHIVLKDSRDIKLKIDKYPIFYIACA